MEARPKSQWRIYVLSTAYWNPKTQSIPWVPFTIHWNLMYVWLEALGKEPDTYGDLLVCILLDKLPGELRKNLVRQHDQDEWTLEELRKALRSEIRILEAGQVTPFHQQPSRHNSNQQHWTTSLNSSSSSSNSPPTCNSVMVNIFHMNALNIGLLKSVGKWRKKHLSFNCLQSTHQV